MIGDERVEILLNIFTRIMETERMPEEWGESTLVQIYKDVLDCGNYRTLS